MTQKANEDANIDKIYIKMMMNARRSIISFVAAAVSSSSSPLSSLLSLSLPNQQSATVRGFLVSTTILRRSPSSTQSASRILFSTQTRSTMAPPKRKKQKTTNSTVALSSSKNVENNESPSKFFIILSPAKTLNMKLKLPQDVPLEWSQPGHVSMEKTNEIKQCMKKHASKSSSHLSKLLGVSANIAETAKSCWDDMDSSKPSYESKPCGYLFQGPAYQGLDIASLEDDSTHIQYLQNHLRIVDPLWGWLRPLDAIPPYRLEMATKNLFGKDDKGKLANYWKPAIQSVAFAESTEKVVVVNVASDEYSSAVLPPVVVDGDNNAVVIKVVFRNKGRVVAVHAKRARGLYTRFLALNGVKSLAEFWNVAPKFDMEYYAFQSKDSSSPDDEGDEITIVYDRTNAPKIVGGKPQM